MLLICPTMQFDVKRLEAKFVHGYHGSDRMFYISLTIDTQDEKVMTIGDEEGCGHH